MKVFIDKDKCQAQKRCFNLYPDIFVEGPDSKGQVREGVDLESEEQQVNAQSAANACPQSAIEIEY